MALRIQHNITAMNAARQLSISDSSLSKSIEKLSSGFRINRASDDAAGLAISQSFRADIAAYKVASRNTTEASALLQVAEGGLEQMSNMLTRLNELATQAASDNVGDTERSKINAEASQLIAEINRLASSTKYGDTALLDGSFGGKTATRADATASTTSSIATSSDDAYVYKYNDVSTDTATVTMSMGSDVFMTEGTWTLDNDATANGISITNGSITCTTAISGGTSAVFDELGITLTFDSTTLTTDIDDDTITVDKSGLTSASWSVDSDASATTYTVYDTGTGISLYDGTNSQSFTGLSDGAQTLDFSSLGVSLALTSDYDVSEQNLNGMTVTVANNGTKTFQVGAENAATSQLTVSVSDCSTGASGFNISDLTLDTSANALAAMTTLETAISTLSNRRADIGAYMNRLSYADASLSVTLENIQAAESVIRDVDMASEMTEFTKNQIQMQAGTAMLAQANMVPQMVLSLFG